MFKLMLTIGLLNLLAAMTPGPDFAIVTQNTLRYSRRIGILTALGVSTGVLLHITYCSLGLAIVITQSTLVFNILKIIGASYLFYLGFQAFTKPSSNITLTNTSSQQSPLTVSPYKAFQQGFLTNALNPKAALFFMALFTMVLNDKQFQWFDALLAIELFFVVFIWFSTLSWLLSHPVIEKRLERAQPYIIKCMGIFLIGFGVALLLTKTH